MSVFERDPDNDQQEEGSEDRLVSYVVRSPLLHEKFGQELKDYARLSEVPAVTVSGDAMKAAKDNPVWLTIPSTVPDSFALTVGRAHDPTVKAAEPEPKRAQAAAPAPEAEQAPEEPSKETAKEPRKATHRRSTHRAAADE